MATEAMEDRDLAINTAERLKAICSTWNITGKVIGLVPDNATKIVLTSDILGTDLDWSHIGLVTHSSCQFMKV